MLSKRKSLSKSDLSGKPEITRAPKSSIEGAEDKILGALELLKRGLTRCEIIKEFYDKYKLSPASTDRYLAKARAEMKAYWTEQKKDLADEISLKYMRVYRLALVNGEFAAANGSLNGLAKLCGLEKPQEINASVNMTVNKKMEDMSDEELLEMMMIAQKNLEATNEPSPQET